MSHKTSHKKSSKPVLFDPVAASGKFARFDAVREAAHDVERRLAAARSADPPESSSPSPTAPAEIEIRHLVTQRDSLVARVMDLTLDAAVGRNFPTAQAKRGRAQRGRSIASIIERLARSDQPAKTLWPRFIQMLDTHGANPREDEKGVTFETDSGGIGRLTFPSFQNRLTRARKKSQRPG